MSTARCRALSQSFSHQKLNKKMTKNQNVFVDDIRIESQTLFCQNGNINIFPCAFEENHFIVANGDRASQKGRMVTEDNGTSHFHPYAVDSGSRYNTLFRTAHGEVKETRESIIFQLRFPKRLGKSLIMSMLRDEQGEQQAFVKTRRSKTIWAS